MDDKLGTELVSKNALSLMNDNECKAHLQADMAVSYAVLMVKVC